MDAPKEKQARQAFWLAHVKAWRDSGLTQKAYCQQQGLKSADVLGYWANRDKREISKLTLVPAQILPSIAHSEAIRLTSPTGWQLALPPSLPVEWVAELLRGLP